MMPLHCLWAKLNDGTRGQFEYDLTWFRFYFDFVRPHAQCGCCYIVCWRGWGGGEGSSGCRWTRFDGDVDGCRWINYQISYISHDLRGPRDQGVI